MSFRFPRLAILGACLFVSSAALADAPSVERYNVSAAGTPGGGARVVVQAPFSVVNSVVTDFGHYQKFIPPFQQARVVGREGDKTDVYIEVPILKNTVKIWAVLRISPPVTSGDDSVVIGKMVKGNVDRPDATWRLHKVGDGSTRLTLELVVKSGLPLPDSFIANEVRSAVGKAVAGTRSEAERRANALASAQ